MSHSSNFHFRNGSGENALSPPSDSGGIYDSHCFATTPSSSNGNCSDLDLPKQVSSKRGWGEGHFLFCCVTSSPAALRQKTQLKDMNKK